MWQKKSYRKVSSFKRDIILMPRAEGKNYHLHNFFESLLEEDIRIIIKEHTYTDPHFQTEQLFCNLTINQVMDALLKIVTFIFWTTPIYYSNLQ